MRVKKQAHKRATRAQIRQREVEDTVARGTAAIFVAAAARVLEREHGWERAAVVAFGDRLAATAQEMAVELLRDTAGGTSGGQGDIAGAVEPDETVMPRAIPADDTGVSPGGAIGSG